MLNPRLCTYNQNKKLSSFLACCLLSLSFILLLGVGCTSALKKVEKDDNKVRDVFNYGLLHGILSCLPEIKEIHTSDTTVTHDTSYISQTVRDTITKKDTLIKIKVVTNTKTIHDTVYRTMRDLSKEDALRKDNAEKDGEIKAGKEIIAQQKKDNNWWKIRFFALLTLFGLCGFFWVRSKIIKSIMPLK